MKLPEPNVFFYMLADDSQYNKFKDIFTRDKGADRGRSSKRNLNIESVKNEIFSKFENAKTVDDFEDILENEFESQYETLMLMYGEGGSSQKYNNFDEALAEFWTRLQKLMLEGGRKKPTVDTTQKIIQTFINDYQNKEAQDDFFNLVKGIMEKTSAKDRSRAISRVREVFSSSQKAKILEILTANFSSQQKPSIKQFYENDIKYFNYFSLEYYLKDIIMSPRKFSGWERVTENAKIEGESENLTMYAKIFKIDEEVETSINRLRNKIADENTKLVGGMENYSLLYEIFKKSDKKLSREKLSTIKIQQKEYKVKRMSQDDKIKKYFKLMSRRSGFKTVDMAITVNNNKSLEPNRGGGFFKRDGKYVDTHPLVENLLLEGLDKALEKVKRSNLVDKDILTQYLSRKYDRDAETRSKERLKDVSPTSIELETAATKLENRLSDKRGINYQEDMLLALFKESKNNQTIQENRPKLAKYAEYLKEDDKIDMSKEGSIFSGSQADMFTKLVRAGRTKGEEIFITFNAEIQNRLATDLPKLAKILGEVIVLNQYTQTVYFQKGKKDGEVKLTRETGEQKTYRELEQKIELKFPDKKTRAIFDYIRASTVGNIFTESPIKSEFIEQDEEGREIKIVEQSFTNYNIVDAIQGIAFAVWLAKKYLNKNYDSEMDEIEESREDLSPDNDSLVNKIKGFASKLERDLKQLKRFTIMGIDEKLEQVANRKGKFARLLKGKQGRLLETYLVDNGLLEVA